MSPSSAAPTESARAELELLARALRAELRRALRRGRLRTAAPADAAAPRRKPAAPQPARAEAAPERPARTAPRRPEPIALSGPRPKLAALFEAPGTRAPAAAARRAPPEAAAGVRALACAAADLGALRAAVADCRACRLAGTRTQTVFADGAGGSGVMFVGEGPGEHEDRQGLPFVGRAGALLTDIITKGMGLARSDVYIANVVKCRPPENRDPEWDEKATCTPFLDRQIELLRPRLLIALGRHAAHHLLETEASMASLRGRIHRTAAGWPLVATYHPAYLLRNPADKPACWADIRMAMEFLGLPLPAARGRGAAPDA